MNFTDSGYSQTLGQSALSIIHLENGIKTELLNTRIPVDDVPIYLRLNIEGRKSWFEWSYDGEHYEKIGGPFDTHIILLIKQRMKDDLLLTLSKKSYL